MDDLSFLDTPGEHIQGNAILKVALPDGDVCLISDRICPFRFLSRCPLLYHAFEYDVHGRLQASIEAPSETVLVSLLRYCYTGSYLPPNADYGPNLLLPHVEMYKMAEDFDSPELQLLAHGNFSCQVDFACCVPAPPPDLVETIQFIYRHYSSKQARRQHGLIDTLLNYSVSKFIYHKLGENADFISIAAGIPEFRQDLCRTNMERNFEDECAFDIIRLCLTTLQVQPCVRPQALASKDELQEIFNGDNIDNIDDSDNEVMPDAVPAAGNEAHMAEDTITMVDSSTTTLVHRPKPPQPNAMEDIETPSSDEEYGFTVVTLPKSHTLATPESPMSSPEVVPTPVVDILAAIGTDYSSDNEWDML